MWPLWLIVAVAVGGATVFTTCSVLSAVYIERKRHRRLVDRHGLDRNLSHYHRPHLSITDVDFSSLPRPMRSLRRSLQSPRRDSRFYSTMPSQDELRTFPDGTVESLAEANYFHTSADRQNQWLSPSKSRKGHRKKKSIKLSISAPMARSPMSAITEQTESTRNGSPEPVELPTQSTPKDTPDKHSALPELVSMGIRHVQQESIDSAVSMQEKPSNHVTTRISHGNMVKSRSISLGSIAPPPDCSLPPVPEVKDSKDDRKPSLNRSKSDLSTHRKSISLLNSPLSPQDVRPAPPIQEMVKRELGTSSFDFGLQDENVQVIKVDTGSSCCDRSQQVKTIQQSEYFLPSESQSPLPTIRVEDDLKDSRKASVPRGLQYLAPSTPNFSSNISEPGSRPISAISAMSLAEYGMLHSTRSSPIRSIHGPPSRPMSVSSVDLFRQSIIGPSVPVLLPDSPRIKGHKRQNCVRISGVIPVDVAKKRISSQLGRLTEAEETDGDDDKSLRLEIPTISPARILSSENLVRTSKFGDQSLDIPKLRQPQALSLRVKQPRLRDRDATMPLFPTATQNHIVEDSQNVEAQTQLDRLPPMRSSIPRYRSKFTDSHFVYAGSPSSDPTKPRPFEEEYSPISPPTPVQEAIIRAATLDKEQKLPIQESETEVSCSPASTSVLFSPTSSPAHGSTAASNTYGLDASVSSSQHPRMTSNLHGPRSAPPPSLRTRNKTYTQRNSPRLRQTSGQRSSSPIRKTSQPRHSNSSGQQRNAVSTQDDLRRSIALLKSLTHAAEIGKGGGLGDVNIARTNSESVSLLPSLVEKPQMVARTPSSRYAESTSIKTSIQPKAKSQSQTTRQRSKTIAGYSVVPPKLRQEMTYPPDNSVSQNVSASYFPSRISIWEDASVKGDDSDDDNQASANAPSLVTRKASRHSDHPTTQRRSLTAVKQQPSPVTQVDGVTKPLQKETLWKLQQNADLITTRALAITHTTTPNASKSPQLAKDKEKNRQLPKLNTFSPPVETAGTTAEQQQQQRRSGSTIMGPRMRQRSHTVTAATMPASRSSIHKEGGDGGKPLRTREGVGLGVDFGRTGYGREMNAKIGSIGIGGDICSFERERERERQWEVGGVFFVNEMERDGIGRLR